MILCSVVIALLHVTVMANMRVSGVMPNIVVVALVIATLTAPLFVSLPMVIISGLTLDLFQSGRLGLATVMLLVVWWVLSELKKRYIHTPSIIIVTLAVFVASVFYDLASTILFRIPFASVGIRVLLNGVYSSILCIIVVGILLIRNPRLMQAESSYVSDIT